MAADELRELPLFAGVSADALGQLAGCATLELEPGQVLALSGDAGSGMFVVLDGVVTVELHNGPVEVGPGGPVGELALLVDDSVRTARARAASRVRCLCLSREEFLTLVESEPSFALELLRVLAQRLQAQTD
jgi:CRP-like cAMP-binding protein